MHDAYIGGHFRRTKITRKAKASDTAENLQLYRVVCFFHPRSSCTIGGCSENNKCVMYDDLGRKNRTTRCNCRFCAASLALQVIFIVEFVEFGSFTEPFKYSITQHNVKQSQSGLTCFALRVMKTGLNCVRNPLC